MTEAGLLNLNGNVLCAVDVETTGLIAGFHDIVQICILPLKADLRPSLEINPFYMTMKPKRPENYDPKTATVNRLTLCETELTGFDPDHAADMLAEWFGNMKLGYQKKLSPLAHNWVFDRQFLIDWLGELNFDHHFDPRYRDTMPGALMMNDRAEFKVEPIPHPKVNLKYLTSIYKIDHENAHDALADCIATAEVYKAMLCLR